MHTLPSVELLWNRNSIPIPTFAVNEFAPPQVANTPAAPRPAKAPVVPSRRRSDDDFGKFTEAKANSGDLIGDGDQYEALKELDEAQKESSRRASMDSRHSDVDVKPVASTTQASQ